ncbi:MAG TPA: hypothetical protein VFC65_03685 [Prolixibacteraceae bacterium]|nr:hypothetical protein [Prolixibacteraceae bacterium]
MNRTDISKYLIHSVRISIDNDLPIDSETLENLYYPLREESGFDDESEVLINIIEEGGVRASPSFRNGNSTIYGDNPVVCFTEMPLINFIQYVHKRNDRTRFTECGIAVLKKEFYKNGGRPVISGLSEDNVFEYLDKNKRIIKPDILPIKEQYRYVNLTRDIDWTHEREWRIKCDKNDKNFSVRDDMRNDSFLTWGVNVFSNSLFSEVILILRSIEEAKLVHDIIQGQLDCGYAKGGQEFCVKIKYLILKESIEFLKRNEINSIEDLPSNAFYSHISPSISDEEKTKLLKVLKKCANMSKAFANDFISNTKFEIESNGLINDISGFAHVASDKIDNKYVRFLLNENLADSIGETIWVKQMERNIPFQQSLSYHEYIAERQCEIFNKEIDDIFRVYSRLD